VVTAAMLATLTGCQSAKYEMYSWFGVEKRDLLQDAVKDASSEQEDAKEQFADTLEQFKAVVGYDGGELEKQFKKFRSEFNAAEDAAADVKGRIDDVETVAEDMFADWEKGLDDYTDQNLRRKSEQLLRDSRGRVADLVVTMRKAEASMYPVLDKFRDQVKFLEDNLRAQAVAALEGETIAIEAQIDDLIEAMNTSINEATAFIEQMEGEGG